MKGRLIFKTGNNEIITADFDIKMKDTKGLYLSANTELFDLEFVGLQRLPEESK